MIQTFHPGEIAIAQNWTGWPQYDGSEVDVLDGLRWRIVQQYYDDGSSQIVGSYSYVVRTRDGELFSAAQHELRKRFDPGSWASMREVWRPRGVEVLT